MRIAAHSRSVLLAATLLALVGCGGDGGGSSASLQSDGAEGGNQTTQCQAGGTVVVSVVVDAPGDLFYGLHTQVRYPGVLDLPGRADFPSVAERVHFPLDVPPGRYDVPEEAFVNGTFIVNDEDTNSDGIDDRIQALLISRTPFPDGKFVDITFDCAETIDWPTADAFACYVAGASDLATNELSPSATCSVVVQPPI